MSTLGTLSECIRETRRARTWRDKLLVFLLAGFGVLGAHRRILRGLYFNWINSFAQNGIVRLNIEVNRVPTVVELRAGNKADYLVACEFVRGSYERPASTPDTIVDAGANIGLFALHAARFFSTARLSCFEPDLENFKQLQQNLSLNEIDAELHHAGVWSMKTNLYYHAQESHTGFVDEHPPGLEIFCELPKISPHCWLKLDVEGAEYAVLPALLSKGIFPRFISMELHHRRQRGDALLEFVRTHGYRVEGPVEVDTDCVNLRLIREGLTQV